MLNIYQFNQNQRQYNKLSNHWKEDKFDASMAKYYQLIYGIDIAVGMILDELENKRLQTIPLSFIQQITDTAQVLTDLVVKSYL